MTAPTGPDEKQVKDTLAYIRETMESASSFTATSGWGLVAIGIVGLVAVVVADLRDLGTDLTLWIPTAVIAVAVSAALTAAKARKLGVPLWSGSFRKLAWVMTPALIAGTMLTVVLAAQGMGQMLPGTWLSLYGAGVAAGGTYSVRAFRWMGVAFLLLGGVAFMQPDVGLWMLGAGFGLLHLAFGAHIIRSFGG